MLCDIRAEALVKRRPVTLPALYKPGGVRAIVQMCS